MARSAPTSPTPPVSWVRSAVCPGFLFFLLTWAALDVLSIPQTNENFRLLYDIKGRFELVPIDAEEAKVVSLRIRMLTAAHCPLLSPCSTSSARSSVIRPTVRVPVPLLISTLTELARGSLLQ